MRKYGLMAAAGSALMLLATPALAGDEERARAAIAEARGKLDAADRVRAGDVSPADIAKAQASLRLAQEELKSGHEQKAIKAAIEAQQYADTALGRTQQRVPVRAEAAVAAPTTTTVTTETVKTGAPTAVGRTVAKTPPRKVVRRTTTAARPRPVVTEKTTTTVTTGG